MAEVGTSSRVRYENYRQELKTRKPGELSEHEKRKEDAVRSQGRGGGQGGGGGGRDGRAARRQRSFWRLFGEFWRLTKGHRGGIFVALTLLGASTILGLLPIYGTKLIIDNVLGDQPLPKEIPSWIMLPAEPRPLLAFVCTAMIVIAFASMFIGTSSRWQATRVTKRVQVQTRRRAFEHAVRLPLHRVYDLKSGGVASILRDDAGGVAELIFSMLYNPSRAIVQLTGSLTILALTDWRMLIGALLLLPIVWFTHRTWIARIRPLWRDIRNTRQGIDAHATESFGGMRVVRSFSRQRHESGRFVSDNHYMTRQELLSWWWGRGIDAAWHVMIPVASALLMWYGGGRVLEHQAQVRAGLLSAQDALTAGDLVMFLGYLTALLGPIAMLAGTATQLQNNLAGLDRTLDLLEEPTEFADHPGTVTLDPARVEGRITLSNVSFAYAARPKKPTPGDSAPTGAQNGQPAPLKLVLDNVSLDVAPGEMIALVGPSGAGKTTFCNLIARFYDPTAGSIALDGVDLKDINVDSYRGLLGIVEQDTFLFDGTIADNIAYGRRHATMDQIVDAARLANAHDFITKLDTGYDSIIGERGVKLSGGQRQRLTIARAILADPKILILDEATSNLDTESERLIQSSLATLMQGRTSFVIAHRLSTIRHADRIIVIDQGRILEQGTHDELMATSGRYQQMVHLQTQPPVMDRHATTQDEVAAAR